MIQNMEGNRPVCHTVYISYSNDAGAIDGQTITITIVSLYPIDFVWGIRRWGKTLRDNNITVSYILLYPIYTVSIYQNFVYCGIIVYILNLNQTLVTSHSENMKAHYRESQHQLKTRT